MSTFVREPNIPNPITETIPPIDNLLAPVGIFRSAKNIDDVKFAKKQKRFRKRDQLFRRSPFSQYKIDWFKGENSENNEICLALEPRNVVEAKSTNSRAIGFWTDGRTHARTHFWKRRFSKSPSTDVIRKKRGKKELSRLLPWSRGVNSSCVFSCCVLSCCVSPTGANNYLSKKGIEETLASCAAVAQLAFEMQNNGATVFEH